MSEIAVNLEVKIQASPEVVFDYLVQPEKLQRWQAESAAFDLRVGGAYRLNVFGEHVAAGEVVAFERPTRLVYTWGWEGSTEHPPGSSTVEYTLEADGPYTLVRVTHRDLPGEQAAASHTEGWNHYLERLSIAASGGDPGPDAWAAQA